MSATHEQADRLQRSIADVYRGPLEDFVRRRDALARERRAAGDREAASLVKGLRKPSRIAWALDLAALDGQHALEPLAAAVAATLDAQAAGGDVRSAIAELRQAVREFASRAACAAEQAGHGLEPAVLASAVLAVLGNQERFEQLRAGRLTDMPAAGGLDFLAMLPVPSTLPPSSDKRASTAARSSAPAREGVDTAAPGAAEQAAAALADERRRTQIAHDAVRTAETILHAAEERRRLAEQEADAARARYEDARRAADAAAARLREAERAAGLGEA